MKSHDYLERGLALGGNFDNGISKLRIERDHEFKSLKILHEGKLIMTLTIGTDGIVMVEVDEETKACFTGAI